MAQRLAAAPEKAELAGVLRVTSSEPSWRRFLSAWLPRSEAPPSEPALNVEVACGEAAPGGAEGAAPVQTAGAVTALRRSLTARAGRAVRFTLSASPAEDPDAGAAFVDLLKSEAADFFADGGWSPCHAAAARIDRGLVILPGAPGSGKSTLSVVLARRGYAVTDELVLLRETGAGVEALVPPLPLSAPEEAVASLPPATAWRLGPLAGRPAADGKALLSPPALLAGTGKVAAVIQLRRGRERVEPSLQRASRSEAARCLLENVRRYSNGGPGYAARRRRAWRTLCALLDRVPVYVLSGELLSEAGAAADRVERVLEGVRHV